MFNKDRRLYALSSLIRVMKLTTFFLLITFISVNASVYSQMTRLDLKVQSKTVKEVLSQIEDQSNFFFMYNDRKIDVERKVDIDLKQANIESVLKTIFDGTNTKYVIKDRQIVLYTESNEEFHASNAQPVGQQQKSVSGKVTDSSGASLPGVSVVVKGTTTGVITDVDGKYILPKVQESAILQFSFVGMKTQEFPVGNKTSINVVLAEETVGIEEVVAIGYGTQKKVNLTGSVSSVDVSKLAETRPITNISTGLAGLAPGLYVKSSGNDPGSNASLLIRGQGTLNTSSPLVIIDGVEGNIGYVSPQDIANISVLKDAASCAIYGSRAANGVILITTKQAEIGKMHISYDGYVAVQSVAYDMPFVSNSVRYMELQNEAARNAGVKENFSQANIQLWKDHEGGDPLLWPNTDWVDAMFRTSQTVNHNIAAQGGTDKIKTFLSFNLSDTPGIIENTGYKKAQVRSNTQLEITPWLNIGMNITGSHSSKDRGSNSLSGMFSNAMASVPTIVNRSPDGRYGGTNNAEDVQTVASPLWYMNQYKGDNIIRTLNSKFYATLNPIEGLNINASYSYNYYDAKVTTRPTQNNRWNFQTNTILVLGKTDLYISNQDARDLRNFADGYISYEKKVFDKLYFKAMAGGSQEQYKYETFSATRYGLIDENLTQIDAATGASSASGTLSDWAMRSFFGRINLSWDDKYLLELNLRRDGSSRFVSQKRWGNFPSVSAGWRISEESFMGSLRDSWLNQLKLRVSYGSLGNNAVGNYDAIPVLSSTQYPLNSIPTVGFYQSSISNANLTWESTYVANAGLDFGLFSNRLNGNVDVYNKLTKNILISLPAPYANGIVSIPPQNSAEVRNRGAELVLEWRDKIRDLNYFIRGNFTYNNNKVVKFKGDQYSLSGTNMIKEGLPINTQYVLLVDRIVQTQEDLDVVQNIINKAPLDANGKKMNPFSTGTPQMGDLLYKDVNGDGLINNDDRTTVGHGQDPRFMYSFSFGANYKGFDLSCQLDGIAGVKTYFQNDYYTPNLRHSNIISKEIADGRWYEGRTTTASFPRLLLGNAKNTVASDFWVVSNAYLKVRNLQLGYTVPSYLLSNLSVSKLRVYASLENFFTISSYPGLDPEVTSMAYPTMKQAVFGINLSF